MQYIIGATIFALIDFIITSVAHLFKKSKHKRDMAKLADEFDSIGYHSSAASIRRRHKIRK